MAAVAVPLSACRRRTPEPSTHVWRAVVAACASAGWVTSAGAHVVPAAGRGPLTFGWTFDTDVVTLLGLSLAAYAVGFLQLYRRSRRAAALWAWHLPMLFEAALVHPALHTLQHACFLLTALLFWWGILETRTPGAARAGSAHAMFSLFTTMVHTSALGALLTLAPGLWYPFYIEPCSLLGMDPLKDQQLGGLIMFIMWVPAALAYLLAALAVAARWLARGQNETVPVIVAATRNNEQRAAAVGDETL